MTDEEALIRMMVEHPADAVPRQVYADWLADRSDPREAFVREPSTLLAKPFDPVWAARVSPPPLGVLAPQLRFTDSGEKRPRLTNDDLNWLESRHQLTLPPDYRAFLVNTNGGNPEPNHFRIPGRGYETGQYEIAVNLCTMFGARDLDEDSDYDLAKRLQHLEDYRQYETRWQGDFHRTLMVVGILPPWDLDWICLACRGPEVGAVYAMAGWLDDDSREESPRIADSFAEFLGLLTDHDEPNVQAIKSGNVAEVVRWLDSGGDKDELYRNAQPIYHAVFHGREAVVKELLARGARTWEGLSQDADRFGHPHIAQLLRAHGC